MEKSNEAWDQKKKERESKREREGGGSGGNRAVVDISVVIHLSDSPPNAPLGETQSCVTRNAAHVHGCKLFTHTPGKSTVTVTDLPCKASCCGSMVKGWKVNAQRAETTATQTHTYSCTCTFAQLDHIC